MPAGYLVHKNGYVLNARYPTDIIRDEVNRGQSGSSKRPRMTTVRPPTASTDDRSIQRGELLWDRIGKNGAMRLSMDQQPYVRSALNGALVDANPSDEIRVLGVSRKTVKYDAKSMDRDPSDDPVIVVSGHETVFNTGENTIRPGEALEWYVVGTDHRNQIRDGVTQFSPDRATLGLRQLSLDSSVRNLCEIDTTFDTLWRSFCTLMEIREVDMNRPVFDNILWAIQKEIVDAYQWSSGVATQNAPNGMRFDEMFMPFMKIEMKPNPNVPELTAGPVVLRADPSPPPPPPSISLRDALISKSVQFPRNFNVLGLGADAVTAYNSVVVSPSNKDVKTLNAYRINVGKLVKAYKDLLTIPEVPGLKYPVIGNVELHMSLWKILALLDRLREEGFVDKTDFDDLSLMLVAAAASSSGLNSYEDAIKEYSKR